MAGISTSPGFAGAVSVTRPGWTPVGSSNGESGGSTGPLAVVVAFMGGACAMLGAIGAPCWTGAGGGVVTNLSGAVVVGIGVGAGVGPGEGNSREALAAFAVAIID